MTTYLDGFDGQAGTDLHLRPVPGGPTWLVDVGGGHLVLDGLGAVTRTPVDASTPIAYFDHGARVPYLEARVGFSTDAPPNASVALLLNGCVPAADGGITAVASISRGGSAVIGTTPAVGGSGGGSRTGLTLPDSFLFRFAYDPITHTGEIFIDGLLVLSAAYRPGFVLTALEAADNTQQGFQLTPPRAVTLAEFTASDGINPPEQPTAQTRPVGWFLG